MKKRRFLVWLMAAALCAGAAHPAAASQKESAPAESTADVQVSAAEVISASEETEAPVPDVDLTPLSTTMLIAEATNIMSHREDYAGKRIRTVGILQAYEYNGRYITNIYIGDAAGCCGTAFEFQRMGEYRYPEDYPVNGSVVFVEGIFESYEEDSITYYRLNDAVMSTSKFWEQPME